MCTISAATLKAFENELNQQEKSRATVEKYLRDVRRFFSFIQGREITKELTLQFKKELTQSLSVVSSNSVIAALNSFLRFLGLEQCCIKQYRIQKKAYCSEEKELSREEYFRLVSAAKNKKNERLSLILQTICATGIRVSELEFITAEAVFKGEATVSCKGKTRTVFIVKELRKQLIKYIKLSGITEGSVFVNSQKRPISRTTVWREMKSLCEQAGVNPSKVFPHNLRHLFARTFYGIEKDIAKLADILGHTSINTTRIYIITTGAEHKRKMEGMHLII